jgi:hypothetical protein
VSKTLSRQHWLGAVALVSWVVFLVLASGATVRAHEIPNQVTIRAFLKPEGQRLRLVVRVPLVAMRDMDYPKYGARNSELLDLARAEQTLRDAATLWVGDFLAVFEDDTRLPYPTIGSVRASLPSDPSFASFDEALAHVTGPRLAEDTEYLWSQGMLDILFEFPIRSDRSHFSVDARFARLGIQTRTLLRFLPPDGSGRDFEFHGDQGTVRLDPGWSDTVAIFGRLGIRQVLEAGEYALLLLVVLMPFRQVRSCAAVLAAFAAAHSLTLIAASDLGFTPNALWFGPLVETLTAASLVYFALENVVSPRLPRRRLLVFGVGLIYGFALSSALQPSMQFAGLHPMAALVSFNIGLELGLALILALLIPALDAIVRFALRGDERLGTIILSVIVGHTAWHWMVDRYSLLRQYRFEWPAIDLAFWAFAIRWTMLLVAGVGVYWLLGMLRPIMASRSSRP